MNKNKLMMVLGAITLTLTLLVQYLHQFSVIDSHNHGPTAAHSIEISNTLPSYFNIVNGTFLIVPVTLLLIAFLIMRVSNEHRLLPLLITLV
ncbi:MAG: hypothetical protein JJU01_07515, partial [Alkalibacterium sp.]|nr:hypothetical protein [Alkalibacterium sp.]